MAANPKSKTKAKSAKKHQQLDIQLTKLFTDKLFRWFTLTAVALGLGGLGWLLFRVRAVDYAVPLQYYSPQGFDALGAWYRAYAFGAFGLLTTVGNLVLAAMSYDKSRIASFFLVMGTLVINLFLVIIILTLTGNFES